MTTTRESQMNTYLNSLRINLGPLTIDERDEITREIEAHVRDSAESSGASVEAILARLGPPKALADQYRDGLLISKASRSISPFVLLRGALRLATKGVFGILVFFIGVFGYAVGGGLVLTAFIKPILPANTGVWLDGSGHLMSSGVLFPPPGSSAHEVLGVWYIPIALIAGSLTLLATTWAIRTALRISRRWQATL